MLVPIQMGTSVASPYKSINYGKNFLRILLHKKNCCDLNLGRVLHIYLLSFLRFWTLSVEQFSYLFSVDLF